MQSYDVKPAPYKAVRVWLPDGTRVLGMWTGERWWSTKGAITPLKWELEERKKKKTKKLRKAFRRSEEGQPEAHGYRKILTEFVAPTTLEPRADKVVSSAHHSTAKSELNETGRIEAAKFQND